MLESYEAMSRVNSEAAIDFVEKEGNAVERARLAFMRDGQSPAPGITAQLAEGQRDDGGWAPFWAGDYSSLDATCFRLAQAAQLGLDATTPCVAAAAQFLAARQRVDGWWEEASAVAAAAPPWAMPGDEAARLYLTANCGYWLVVLNGPSEATRKAVNRLAEQVNDTGAMPTFLHAHWLAAGLWHLTGHASQTGKTLAYLNTHLAQLSANNLTWLIVALRTAGILANQPLLVGALARLRHLQQGDGRWLSDDAMERDVHVTLEALRAIQLCA